MTNNKPNEFKPVKTPPYDGKIKYFSEEDGKNAIFKGDIVRVDHDGKPVKD